MIVTSMRRHFVCFGALQLIFLLRMGRFFHSLNESLLVSINLRRQFLQISHPHNVIIVCRQRENLNAPQNPHRTVSLVWLCW